MRSVVLLGTLAALIAGCVADSAPGPVVVPASEHFEGNDGPWSSFDLRVGTPEQFVRVLVSTASPESMVVLSSYGCSSQEFSTVPPDCANSRGVLFNQSQSSSWRDAGNYSINEGGIGLEANLGYNLGADFGLDHMAIGLTSPASLDNQTIAGIIAPEPLYLGIFGLNNQPVNFTTLGNTSVPSFLTTLKNQNIIPSLSWSYTAGAQYRLKQVYGQLIFSGYDTSRFTENSVSFTMAQDVTRDLVVVLQSVSSNTSSSANMLSGPINIFIDSTDPNIWLPDDACDAFEKAFGITLDNSTGMYLVDDDLHSKLLSSNPNVTFTLSDVQSGGSTVAISLPYAAFDLTAEAPLVANSSRYFPLKRASNSTQYTLGRTFLQEAYLSADYERMVFNVSACAWNEGAQQNIVAITSKNASSATGGSSSGHLSGGAIAGVVVGSVAGVLVLVGLVVLLLRKRREWMGVGFAARSGTPEPSKSILEGPVFNENEPRSMTERSTSQSAAAGSGAPRSTTEYSRSGAGSSSPGKLGVAGISSESGTNSTPELDGRETGVRPDAELDAEETQVGGRLGAIAENRSATVHELQGTEVARNGGSPAAAGALHSERRQGGSNSPPSPFTSTLDSTGWPDGGGTADSHLVSPASTFYGRRRPF